MADSRQVATVHCKDCAMATRVRDQNVSIRQRIATLATYIALAVYITGSASAAQRTHASDDRAAAKLVESYFASLSGYQKGDLITRSQIDKALAKLSVSGFQIKDSDGITKLGLADDSFLVRELSTAEGLRFMRKLGQHPGAFANLDRLSTIPRGQTLVRDLIRQKDGDKMIEYLATTKGGKNMGGMMAQARGGVDLNKPTGRIYTVDDLVAALKGAAAKPTP